MTRLHIAHASLQFSDTTTQWRHDTRTIFGLGYHIIGGTEAGENRNWQILRQEAHGRGYVIDRYKSNWLAVHSDQVRGRVKWVHRTVADNDQVVGRGHDSNYITGTFTHANPRVGGITAMTSHYPTKGQWYHPAPSRRVNTWITRKMGRVTSRTLAQMSRGRKLGFYTGDQNLSDRVVDTFSGGPLTTCWDELGKWPNTGHGNIDVIASFDGDTRVKCLSARALNDKTLFLHGDHFLIEAVYEIGE